MVIVLCTTIFYSGNSNNSRAEEINQHIEEFNLDLKISADEYDEKYDDLKYSSNPYDFKVLPSYKRIVDYGPEVVPILEKKVLSGNDGSAEDIMAKLSKYIYDEPQ